jgi:hypothetical protein
MSNGRLVDICAALPQAHLYIFSEQEYGYILMKEMKQKTFSTCVTDQVS